MGKIPSIPDKTTQQSMETCDEITADSCGSERTISDDLGGKPYFGNQAEDDALEADSAMVLLSPAVVEKEERSDSGRRLQGDSFVQISGHGYTDGLEVDSASRTKRAVVKAKSLQYIPLDGWLKKIDSGKGIWKAAKSFRSNGKADKKYFHVDYDEAFRSKPEVLEFISNGTVRGKKIIKRSASTRTNVHDGRQTTKTQRTGAATSTNTSGSTGSTRGKMTRTCPKLPHGFL